MDKAQDYFIKKNKKTKDNSGLQLNTMNQYTLHPAIFKNYNKTETNKKKKKKIFYEYNACKLETDVEKEI